MQSNFPTTEKNILKACRELADRFGIKYDAYTTVSEFKEMITQKSAQLISGNYDYYKRSDRDFKIKQAKKIKKAIIINNNPQTTSSNYEIFTVMVEGVPISSVVFLRSSKPQFIHSAIIDFLKTKLYLALPSIDEKDSISNEEIQRDLNTKANYANEFTVNELPMNTDDIKFLSNLK